jgi:hypothetical protein
MEHENASGGEHAAPSPAGQLSPPDQLSPPHPQTAAEPAETAADTDEADSEESGETWQATGEPRVDAALGHLSELDEMPVSQHPGVYERVHEQLVDVLGELHQGTQSR